MSFGLTLRATLFPNNILVSAQGHPLPPWSQGRGAMDVRSASFGSFGSRALRSSPRVAAVVGGAGFVGSHLCEALLARGREVICIDNFQRGSIHNLVGLVGKPRGLVVSHDAARRIPDNLPPFDEIYHLAALPDPFAGPDRGEARRCARIAVTLLDRAARDGARVLLVSPPSEAARARVRADAAVGDHGTPGLGFAELLFTRYAAKRGVTLKVARMVETYGPRMPLDSACVVASHLIRALRGGEAAAGGDSEQARGLCFVNDVVEGCLSLMEMEADIPAPVDIAAPTRITSAGLARIISELTEESPPAAMRSSAFAEDASGTAMGLRPKTSLRDGLRLTISDFAARFGVSAARQHTFAYVRGAAAATSQPALK